MSINREKSRDPRRSANRGVGSSILPLAILALSLLLAPTSAFGAVYRVPAGIADDCSVAVEAQLATWLASVPDGNTARLGAEKCYGQDDSLTIADRSGLRIDGNGSELRALTPGSSHRSNLRLVKGSNLTVVDLVLRGANAQHRSYLDDEAHQWQHGVNVAGTQGVLLRDLTVTETLGDGVNAHSADLNGCSDSPARNVVIHGLESSYTGRNGVSLTWAERVLISNSRIFTNLGLAPVDIEPDDPCWWVRDVLIWRNSFDEPRSTAIQYWGLGGISNVRAGKNTFAGD